MKEKIHQILKSYWGYEQFRPLQEEIILSVLSHKDTLALLPTGGGKSICFQVPGLALENGMTLVVSPLIALMHDQVANLRKRNISAVAITSSLSLQEIEEYLHAAIDNKIKFLYVSPERLESKLFQEALPQMNTNLLAIDEAHCISQWGYDFRPSYLKISDIKKHLYDPHIPIIALTASATQKVLEDIIEKLQLRHPNIFKQSFARKNLRYVVLYESNKIERIQKIIQRVGGAGIIYVRSRNKTKEISDILNQKGIQADYFHAGLTSKEKFFKQKKFIDNAYQVMVATNAFGMGIDKPDVRYVIHYELSDSLESYFQEAGRAGRDGQTSYCILLHTEADKDKALKMFDDSFPSLNDIKKVYNHLCNYYELAIDEGEGQSFDFNIQDISNIYKLPLSLIYHSIKFLELFELISIEEEVYQPSRCCIHYSKLDLYDFYVHHPEYEDLIRTLLRSYGGIIGNHVFIYENDIAYKIKRNKEYVKQQLQLLDKEGVLSYHPLTGYPKITFLKDRIALSKLELDENKYQFLKERRQFLIQKMIEYAEQHYLCREQFLLNYFDEINHNPCGYCDICLYHKKLPTIQHIKTEILQYLQNSTQKNITINELYNIFSFHNKELVLQAIRELADDNLVSLSNDVVKYDDINTQ